MGENLGVLTVLPVVRLGNARPALTELVIVCCNPSYLYPINDAVVAADAANADSLALAAPVVAKLLPV